MRFVCCPFESIPKTRASDTEYISLYRSRALAELDVGDVALDLKKEVRASGIQPSVEAWDFCSIAVAVAAIDKSAPRKNSADGWTRVLESEIYLAEPLTWQNQIPKLEETLRDLTGDFWKLSFSMGGDQPPKPKYVINRNADCVSLLSGGVDSLVGAIDLCQSGKNPILLSKVVQGDKQYQKQIASNLVTPISHLQWRFNSRSTSESEGSTRARSIIFFAYAALVASSLCVDKENMEKIPILVPENGFISLNIPLTPLRMGTLSTKTTHPLFLRGLQDIWNSVGIKAKLICPYQFKTKGEMLQECSDNDLLASLIGKSTSCGRYGHYNRTHCGRCVPCLVRRAGFLKAGLPDSTELSQYEGQSTQYVFQNLAVAATDDSSNDIRAAGHACIQVENEGIDKFVGAGLSFVSPSDRPRFVGVIDRGLSEIKALLKQHRVL